MLNCSFTADETNFFWIKKTFVAFVKKTKTIVSVKYLGDTETSKYKLRKKELKKRTPKYPLLRNK